MKSLLRIVSIVLIAGVAFAVGVPRSINYQGTIKQNGVPVNSATTVSFRLTNVDGSALYWSSGNMQITPVQGMFSITLNPTGVDWQSVTPYIELSVQGQILLPREQMNSTAYALMSESVADGSVGTSKMADFSVTTIKIADSAVTSNKLADGSVTSLKVAAGAIGAAQLADNAVSSSKLANGSITNDKLASTVQNFILPAGIISSYAGANAPAGWLLCDGHEVSRTEYANLFAAISTTWGGGDGVNTFNIPDLRGRVPMGVGQGPGLSNRNLAQKLGEENHLLSANEMPNHNHTMHDPGHTHTVASNAGVMYGNFGGGSGPGGGISAPAGYPAFSDLISARNNSTGITIDSAGGGAAHPIIQPSTVVQFIIKI